jgi:hypothetical protein
VPATYSSRLLMPSPSESSPGLIPASVLVPRRSDLISPRVCAKKPDFHQCVVEIDRRERSRHSPGEIKNAIQAVEATPAPLQDMEKVIKNHVRLSRRCRGASPDRSTMPRAPVDLAKKVKMTHR